MQNGPGSGGRKGRNERVFGLQYLHDEETGFNAPSVSGRSRLRFLGLSDECQGFM